MVMLNKKKEKIYIYICIQMFQNYKIVIIREIVQRHISKVLHQRKKREKQKKQKKTNRNFFYWRNRGNGVNTNLNIIYYFFPSTFTTPKHNVNLKIYDINKRNK